jgi:hypothetical protein
MRGGQSCSGTCLYPSAFGFPLVVVILPLLHIHLSLLLRYESPDEEHIITSMAFKSGACRVRESAFYQKSLLNVVP